MRNEANLRRCLLIVDMQNDFISTKGAFAHMGFDIKSLKRVIPTIRAFRESPKSLGIPTIYVLSHYDEIYLTDSIKERYKWVNYNIPFCITGTWGSQIADVIAPEKEDITIIKHRYNAFLGTNLDSLLKGMNVDTLIFAGVETHVCVQQTAIHAYMLGYKVILVEDCTASMDPNDKKYALEYCKRYYGVVKSSEQILRQEQAAF